MTHVYLWWAVEIYGSCPVYSYIPSITESHRKPEVSNPGRCGRLLGQDHGPFWQRTAQQKHAVFPWKCWWNPQLFMQISMISWDDWGKKPTDFRGLSHRFFSKFLKSQLGWVPSHSFEWSNLHLVVSALKKTMNIDGASKPSAEMDGFFLIFGTTFWATNPTVY